MNTSETITLTVCIMLVLCVLITGLIMSEMASTKALGYCIEKTGKPLECKASYRY